MLRIALPSEKFLDPLRGPFRADLRARDPPDLLGIRAEEGVVEPPPEAVVTQSSKVSGFRDAGASGCQR